MLMSIHISIKKEIPEKMVKMRAHRLIKGKTSAEMIFWGRHFKNTAKQAKGVTYRLIKSHYFPRAAEANQQGNIYLNTITIQEKKPNYHRITTQAPFNLKLLQKKHSNFGIIINHQLIHKSKLRLMLSKINKVAYWGREKVCLNLNSWLVIALIRFWIFMILVDIW